MSVYLLWILAYSLVLVLLGVVLSRRVRLAGDFLVAGRRLGPGLVFTTFLAANIGAGTSVGAASLGYELGWSSWWWVGSAGIGCLILANSLGPRIWRIATANNYHTLGDYLEGRYSRAVRGWISLILTIGSIGLLAAQLIALSIVFHVITGVPQWVGSILGGAVLIIYFTAGGLLSSAWINLLELAVLLAGFILTLQFALDASQGWDGVIQQLTSRMDAGASARYLSPVGFGPAGILYHLALLVPSFIASPGLIQKIYGARSASAARRGVNANALAMLVFAALPPSLGMIAAARFPTLADPQLAMFKIMTDMLPLWLGVLGLAAVFSAEVSTCDAVLLMLSSSFTVDLYKSFLNPHASDRLLLRVSRYSSLGAGLLGVLMAIRIPSIIAALTLFYSLVSVALFVPLVAGLYSQRPDARAALSAIGVSVPATLLAYRIFGARMFGFLNPFLLGIALSFVVLWGCTLWRERHG